MVLFTGRFVLTGHCWPLADLIRRVCFSDPQVAVSKSLCDAYAGYTELLHQTSPVLMTSQNPEVGQVVRGKATRLDFQTPGMVPPGDRCTCQAHPLNWRVSGKKKTCKACGVTVPVTGRTGGSTSVEGFFFISM